MPAVDKPGPAHDVWTILVAAGSGSRFGGAKQYARLAGQRVVDWSLSVAREASAGVVLVVPAGREGGSEAADVVVVGGATRSESVRAGLARVPPDAAVVVVHDAARPLAAAGLFESTIGAVRAGADAAVPVVAVTDTLRHRDGGGVVDRDGLVAVQTPQAFRVDALRRAHAGGGEATDDASLVERSGGRVVIVEGDPANRKITDATDLVAAEAVLGGRDGADR